MPHATATEPFRPRRVLQACGAALLLHATPSIAQEVKGMGLDEPVASAMRQIVPPGHVVRFGPGVSPQTHVDWHGQGTWEETMQGALAPKGLRAVRRGNAIEVVSDRPATPARATASRRTRRRDPEADAVPEAPGFTYAAPSDLTPTSLVGMPEMNAPAPVARALPYPNTPPSASGPAAPVLPAPSYAPPQSYAVPPSRSYPAPATALPSAAVPNYDPPAAAASYQVQGAWHAEANAYLDDVINRWCNQAGGGWRLTRGRPTCLDLKTELRYRLTNSITINKDFEHAVIDLVNAVHAPIAPYVAVHPKSFVVELTDSEHLSQSNAP